MGELIFVIDRAVFEGSESKEAKKLAKRIGTYLIAEPIVAARAAAVKNRTLIVVLVFL